MRNYFLILYLLFSILCANGAEKTYYTLNRQNGMADNVVLQMMQLGDGRMAIETQSGLNIYNGNSFRVVRIEKKDWSSLAGYQGYTHMYLDKQDRLWIKDHLRVCSVDLHKLSLVDSPLKLIGDKAVNDFFIDEEHNTWVVKDNGISCMQTSVVLRGAKSRGLQDLTKNGDKLFLFYDDGTIIAFDNKTGKKLKEIKEYDEAKAQRYSGTSLVVKGKDGILYQIRTGRGGSVLLKYDTRKGNCSVLYECDYLLHTLSLTKEGKLLVSSAKGYLVFDTKKNSAPIRLNSLRLPDGTELSTGVNTICQDREGSLWLGTYQKGVLYTSELADLFSTKSIDIDVTPILTTVFLQGSPLKIGEKYNGKVLLKEDAPYIDKLDFDYDENALAFQFSTMNYLRPRSTVYRYRLNDGPWCQVSADSLGNVVDDKGVMYLSFLNLQPGDYSLSVMATTNPARWNNAPRTIHFTIHSPWWDTPLAWIVYALFALGVFGTSVYYYIRRMKSRIQQHHREQVLMVADESDFVNKVREVIEKHISDCDFTVEQLASEMCMERTGLYKKLSALTDDSPVVFIRNIRLKHAAELLKEGKYKTSEVADRCGFNSASYFAKCFKQAYGVKPTDYR